MHKLCQAMSLQTSTRFLWTWIHLSPNLSSLTNARQLLHITNTRFVRITKLYPLYIVKSIASRFLGSKCASRATTNVQTSNCCDGFLSRSHMSRHECSGWSQSLVSIPRSLQSGIQLALNVHKWGTFHLHFFTSKLGHRCDQRCLVLRFYHPAIWFVNEDSEVVLEDIQIWHRVTYACRLEWFRQLLWPHLQYWLSEQILIQLQPPSKIALIIYLLLETHTLTQEIHRKNYPSCSVSTHLTGFRIGSRIAQMSTLVFVMGGSRSTLQVCTYT